MHDGQKPRQLLIDWLYTLATDAESNVVVFTLRAGQIRDEIDGLPHALVRVPLRSEIQC